MRASERERGKRERKKKRSAIEVGPFPNVILLLPANRILILDSRFSVQDIGGGHWIKSWSFINEARIQSLDSTPP